MRMFDDPANSSKGQKRKEGILTKLGRMRKTLNHQEPDRAPISDFFWGRFIARWRKDLDLPDDANPYYYYDLIPHSI